MTEPRTFPLETDFFPDYVIDEMLKHFSETDLINIIAQSWAERGRLAAGKPLTAHAVDMVETLMKVRRLDRETAQTIAT